MRDNDNDLKSALDDIFGSDFIEIDIKKDENVEVKGDSVINTDINVYDQEENKSKEIKNNDYQTVVTNDAKEKLYKEQNVKKDKKNKGKFFLIILFFMVVVIVGLYICVNYAMKKKKIVDCTIYAKDEGYEYTDEYKISYIKDNIVYIKSTYEYTALTDEYKEQIEYVKKRKLRPIINSNGMPGFTYTYETSDTHFKVNGYLDFSKINFEVIDDMDQDLMPVGYFKLNSKITFNKLKNDLESDGYVCTLSK